MDRTLIRFIGELAQVAVYIFAALFYAHLIPALDRLGNVLLASVSVASVVIGLAAQQALSNLIAGISLLLYRPFRLGDLLTVSIPGGVETGWIESLDLGYTVLRTADNRKILVPNSIISGQTTINVSSRNQAATVSIPVKLGSKGDVDQARALLLELGGRHAKPPAACSCNITAVASSSVELTLTVPCETPDVVAQTKSDLLREIKQRFDAEGVEFS
jgi:small-conductance mechanosensitive channel